jgi:16S rRNA (adenine1518-N6/adenine1519-N6)-dimethyltransferase
MPATRPDGRPHRPRKRFGQHFLEPVWADKVVAAIAPGADDLFLEIGPGRGILTRRLAARAKQVVAIEIDHDLAKALSAESIPNVSVVDADFLEFQIGAIAVDTAPPTPADSLRIAGNLPYNVASPILFHTIDLFGTSPFRDATFMLQREVADRLLAKPGTKEYGVLTALIGLHARVERLLNLPPGAFRPPPKVQSTVVRLHFHRPEPAPKSLEAFRGVVNAIFTRRRKTLANALLAYRQLTPAMARAAIAGASLDAAQRPETLNLAQLVALADALTVRP